MTTPRPNIRLIAKSTTNADEAMQNLINGLCIATNCATCYHSQWNADSTQVFCDKYKAVPPLWAVAAGCAEYDYLPF